MQLTIHPFWQGDNKIHQKKPNPVWALHNNFFV